MSSASDYDSVIVGGGALGSCAAENLAADHDVLLLEKGQTIDNASARAAAFVTDWWYFLGREYVPGAIEIQREYFENLDGTGLFETYSHPYVALIGDNGNRLRSDDENRRLKEIAGKIDDVSHYSDRELKERWPGLINLEGISGGVVDERSVTIDPVHFLSATKAKAEEKGAEFRTQTEVTSIITDEGSAVGVEIEGDSDPVYADNVIVAAGTHTDKLVSDFVDLPVFPFVIAGVPIRHQRESELPDDMPIVADEEMMIGPDSHGNLTSGIEIWIDGPDDIPETLPEKDLKESAAHFPELLNGFDDVRQMMNRPYKCPEGITITPDQLPVVDALDQPDGLIVADGSRGGVSMGPVIAEAIRSILTGSETPFDLGDFEVDRFDPDLSEADVPFVADSS
jgi:glycine/D-amino acid oxidase-like deaminating enzyme